MLKIEFGFVVPELFNSLRNWALSGSVHRSEGHFAINGQLLGFYAEFYYDDGK